MRLLLRVRVVALVAAAASLGMTGCTFHKAVVPFADMPRELNKTSAPEYVIEPPDVVLLDLVSAIPKDGYKLQPLDALALRLGMRQVGGSREDWADAIRAAAEQYGFRLVDLYHAASMRDLDTWDVDRVHASTKGHILFAAAAAEALGLPGSNHDWAAPSGSPTRLSFQSRTYGQLRWMQGKFMPWIWRRLRGMSSADGRVPKRPRPEPLIIASEPVAARLGGRSGILDA